MELGFVFLCFVLQLLELQLDQVDVDDDCFGQQLGECFVDEEVDCDGEIVLECEVVYVLL